ncbi:coproporphyrinogen dehydrogenase HemZ [Porcipelethomonas sp.]|uniref:coproporphyrinogen dehydrogenase HemZ n=1 Tax=Porcipelethomonas sp. TaxID=2981675 RepID=UPI003EFB37EC
MKILFSGHDFKYETEATVKLFIPSRFTFHYDITDAPGDIVMSRLKTGKKYTYLYAYCRLNGKSCRKACHIPNAGADKNTCEHEICRLIYLCLQQLTGITPPWGLMTGIRPVKKMVSLLESGADKQQAFQILKDKYMVSQSRLELAYMTAENQIPLLKGMDCKTISLYISIPFCPTRCSYCSFISHSMDSARKLIPDYIRYLCREIEILGKIINNLGLKTDTVYFGGGTPTSLEASQLEIIMNKLAECIDISSVREYNVEAGRPDTITMDKLQTIKKSGVTRISVNPQTLNNDVLKIIGRRHTAEDTVKAFYMAREAGFDNINMDLIAGLPGDTYQSFENTLDKVLEMNPESITVHTLTIKRSAKLYDEKVKTSADNPTSKMVGKSIELLPEHGYNPYYLYRQKNTIENLENIGFAKKGKESLYNIFIMDETQTILGAGCAASTKLVTPDGKITRIHNYKFPYEYINRFNELMEKKKQIYEILEK